MESYIYGLVGGLIIGIATMMLMISIGRIAGISGILFTSIKAPSSNLWAVLFVVGLALGAALYHAVSGAPAPGFEVPIEVIIAAGLLVGFGVKFGSGCTSGHGICGIGRLSVRSIIATITFMTFGFITVFVRLHLL